MGLMAWCFQLGRVWQRWSQVQPVLHLQWAADASEQGSWRLMEWEQAVSVNMMLDLQDWMLLRVSSLSKRRPATLWSWVKARGLQSPDANQPLATPHRLRTLLYQTDNQRTPSERLGPDAQVWAKTEFQATQLMPGYGTDGAASRARSGEGH